MPAKPLAKGNAMAAVLLRLCEEDRAKYEITKEWLRFDEVELDDLDGVMLSDYEAGLGVQSFEVLFGYDKPRDTIRWKMAQVWLACRLAGFAVPDMFSFLIKIRKVERIQEPAEGGDADPPDQGTSEPPSAAARSKKR